jgi:hypothetical protein
VAPAAIAFLAISNQAVAVHINIPASLSIGAGRNTALRATTIPTIIAIATVALRTKKAPVVIDNLIGAEVNVVQRRSTPPAIPFLALRYQSIAVHIDVAAGLDIIPWRITALQASPVGPLVAIIVTIPTPAPVAIITLGAHQSSVVIDNFTGAAVIVI